MKAPTPLLLFILLQNQMPGKSSYSSSSSSVILGNFFFIAFSFHKTLFTSKIVFLLVGHVDTTFVGRGYVGVVITSDRMWSSGLGLYFRYRMWSKWACFYFRRPAEVCRRKRFVQGCKVQNNCKLDSYHVQLYSSPEVGRRRAQREKER